MNCIATKYGNLKGAVFKAAYANGHPSEVMLEDENILNTSYGALIPHYSARSDLRRYETDIMFYPDGELKYVALRKRTLLKTNYGAIPCFSAMFYENGALKHVFAEDMADASGFDNDLELDFSENIRINTDSGTIYARVTGMAFYPDGTLANVSFPCGELVNMNTPEGIIKIRHGIYFHENGAVKSLEPAAPIRVNTPIGEFIAFNPGVEHNCGKNNSLTFTAEGKVESLTTVHNLISALDKNHTELIFMPERNADSYFDELNSFCPLKISFNNKGEVFIEDSSLVINECRFDEYSLIEHEK